MLSGDLNTELVAGIYVMRTLHSVRQRRESESCRDSVSSILVRQFGQIQVLLAFLLAEATVISGNR